MSNAIIPEIVGQTEILEESPMTEQEQKELIETETIIKSSFQGKNGKRFSYRCWSFENKKT